MTQYGVNKRLSVILVLSVIRVLSVNRAPSVVLVLGVVLVPSVSVGGREGDKRSARDMPKSTTLNFQLSSWSCLTRA